LHFIEVKGRIEGADTVTLTTNELLVALNAAERFVLAVVRVTTSGFAREPVYIRRPFDSTPMTGSSLTTFPVDELIARGGKPN
jgi:hypothetical protein